MGLLIDLKYKNCCILLIGIKYNICITTLLYFLFREYLLLEKRCSEKKVLDFRVKYHSGISIRESSGYQP